MFLKKYILQKQAEKSVHQAKFFEEFMKSFFYQAASRGKTTIRHTIFL